MHGFVRDDQLTGYEARTDFTKFIFERACQFEQHVVDYLDDRIGVTRIAHCAADIRQRCKFEETVAAMVEGQEIIAQAVLWDVDTRTFGAADLLVRSDILCDLFPNALTRAEAQVPAPFVSEGASWHYRVVDIKYATLHLDAQGHASYTDHSPYLAQVFLYNRAVGSVQGFEPSCGYLLGRGWVQRDTRGNNCLERLAPVNMSYSSPRSHIVLSDVVSEAVAWRRRLQREGANWETTPEPPVPELRPNMCNQQDQPWHAAKRQIAEAQGELTLLWQVGPAKRDDATVRGIRRWDDPAVSASDLGINGGYRPILDRILEVNRNTASPAVQPKRIHAAEDVWRSPMPVEFYVDFETVSDLNDDFSRFPEKSGQPLIFMIGCGYIENGSWRFNSFTVRDLTEPEEARVIDEWFSHMRAVQLRLAPDVLDPLVFHWSPAETSSLTAAYNAARVRHADRDWPEPKWFDFLKLVVKAEPVVVRGAMAFGLKPMAKALHKHGCIKTTWEDGPTDGLGAMVGAWRCSEEANERGCALEDTHLMQEIMRYNEVDCRTTMEVLSYLRRCH